MKTKTEILLQLWIEARTRFSNQLENIDEPSLQKKLSDSPNALGFLIRHVAEVELLFAKNIFGDSTVKISAKTIIAQKDTGEWTNLLALKNYAAEAYEKLNAILKKQTDENWEETITTKEFGTKTKAEAFGRIISHTAYHAGQMVLINKYGTI